MKKSTKKFAISTEAKNDKGFRVRTSGIDISDYQHNPIMLFMHQRPTGKSRDEVGVIGNFVDLAFESDTLWGVPSFDDTDEFAMRLCKKVENGTMRMVSAGLIPLSWAKDAAGDLWLETSNLFEISLADKGSNAQSLAVNLYNESKELITLTLDQITENLKPEINMKTINLAAVIPILGLTADATVATATEAIQALVTLSSDQKDKISTLESDKATLTLSKTNAEDELKTYKDAATEAENKAFVELASNEGKFVPAEIPNYIALMAKAPEETKKIIDAMPTSESIIALMKKNATDDKNSLVNLSYDELDKSNQLIQLKADNLPVFKEKFKAKFGRDYKE